MNNNIFSDEIRTFFLKNSSEQDLNIYLNKLEKLSYQFGGKYYDIYESDKKFLLKNKPKQKINLLFQNAGFFSNAKKKTNYSVSIGDLPLNSYCSLIQQKGKIDNRCSNRILELDKIKNLFDNVSSGKYAIDKNNMPTIKYYMRRFIEIILCCSEYYVDNKIIKKTQLIPAVKIVANDPILTNIASKYLSWILTNEKGKYIKEYGKLEQQIRAAKLAGKRNTPEFLKLQQEKQKMIDKYGVNVLYITKLINWIFEENLKDLNTI
ncbi:Hypothetical protein KVN_LOCUS291 [uncultured virus]|nr:Hypothetical protein KVN_LOCUS291 [uncultured virus]